MGFIDNLGCGFKYFLYVHPYLRKIPILTNIFQMGLVQPPTRYHMGVSKHRGYPKMDDLYPIRLEFFGGTPIFGNIHIDTRWFFFRISEPLTGIIIDALPRIWLAPGHAPGQKLSEKERYEKVSRLVSFQIPSRVGTGTITYPT